MATPLEDPPTQAPAHKRSFFKKGRKGKVADVSIQSRVSSSGDDGDGDGMIASRTSTDSNTDKNGGSISRRSSETSSRRSSEGTRRLSKLLPGKLKPHRSGTEDVGRRGSLLAVESAIDQAPRLSRQSSSTSLNNKSGSVHSSLMTEDSGDPPDSISSSSSIRPTISPHDSHAGYLTASSPQIIIAADDQATTSQPREQFRSLPAEIPPKPQTRNDDLAPEQHFPERRHSPVDKFRSALTGGKKKQSLEDRLRSAAAGGLTGAATEAKSKAVKETLDAPAHAISQLRAEETSIRPGKGAESAAAPRPPPIDTSKQPATPTNGPVAPETLITPPTPTRISPTKSSSPTKAVADSPTSRGRSRPKSFSIGNLTSSKSNSSLVGPALTPHPEEAKTPNGSLTSPTQGGFFSSVFSAAQNAANQLSGPFQGQVGKSKPDTPERSASKSIGVTEQEVASPKAETPKSARQAPVIDYPKGISKLANLGIDASEQSPMTTTLDAAGDARASNAGANGASSDEAGAASAISAAYENPVVAAVAQAHGGRPHSVASQRSLCSEQSPSRATTFPVDSVDMKRSGSIRSRLSDRKKVKKQGSVAGTVTSHSSTALVPTPSLSGSVPPRPTGFAVASSKRNKDFHALFRSVPEDDYLIEDYSAALQRDILLHGRFYVSEGHLCFASNILGWVTNLVIAFDEIQMIEKKNTAIVFPNAIVIQTSHSRNVFASFVMRDSTYDLLLGIWKTSHPNLRISPNSASVDAGVDGEKTEKGDSTGSDDGSDDDPDDVYDEDEDVDDELVSADHSFNGSAAASDAGDGLAPGKSSVQPPGGASPIVAIPKGFDGPPLEPAAATPTSSGGPGPASHEPTECSDSSTHYDRPLIDTIIPAPLGKIYSLAFGPQSNTFMRKFLVDDQKSRELDLDFPTGLDNAHKSFVCSYIKPLNAPVGPRQTKCIVTSTLQAFDLEKAVSIDCSTQTPDVPSGNIFTTKTRYCLMWGPGNSTRMIATCTVDWTGKSWLKGPIEKGANDGQIQYVKDFVAALKLATTKPSKGTVGKGKKGKKGVTREAAAVQEEVTAKQAEEDWGLLDPLRPTLGPLVSLVKPFFSPHIVIAVLLVLLVQSWWTNMSPTGGKDVARVGSKQRMAAYEALWAREEAELWDWLEDRVGLDVGITAVEGRQKVLKGKVEKRLKDEKMNEREVEEAIRVTEERLGALKEAVKRRKS